MLPLLYNLNLKNYLPKKLRIYQLILLKIVKDTQFDFKITLGSLIKFFIKKK